MKNLDFKILAIWVDNWLRVAYHKEGNPSNASHATVFFKGTGPVAQCDL